MIEMNKHKIYFILKQTRIAPDFAAAIHVISHSI